MSSTKQVLVRRQKIGPKSFIDPHWKNSKFDRYQKPQLGLLDVRWIKALMPDVEGIVRIHKLSIDEPT